MTFAGAEANVAVGIAQLGGAASFVTALPDHAIADACVANLRAWGVDTEHIVRTTSGRLGLFFLETGANQRSGNVIYDRDQAAVALTPPESYDWDAIFAGADWFHISGITPAISRIGSEVALTAVQEASRRGLVVSCDPNYRSKLWRWDPPAAPLELAARPLRTLLEFVTVFIGGREDAASLLNLHARPDAADPQADVARQIGRRYPRLQLVATSLRESISASHNNWGGMLYDAVRDQAFYAPLHQEAYQPYTINSIVDRVGTGDAFSAGLIFARTTPELASPEIAIAFATAAGCLAHSIVGDFNFCSRAEVETLMGGAVSGRLNR